MNRSDSIKNLAQALVKFQQEVENPKNTADNPFYNSKYAPLNDVLSYVRPLLAKHGLSVIQNTGGDGNNISVATTLIHTSGEWLETEPLVLRNEDSKGRTTAQGAGSAITYARRYSLSAILGISSEDDDDGNYASGNHNNKSRNKSKKSYSNKSSKSKSKKKSSNDNSKINLNDPGETVIGFGDYAGNKLKDVSNEYVSYLADNAFDENMRKAATKYLRNQEIGNIVNRHPELKKEVTNYIKTHNGKSLLDLSKDEYKGLLDYLNDLEEPLNIDPAEVESFGG